MLLKQKISVIAHRAEEVDYMTELIRLFSMLRQQL